MNAPRVSPVVVFGVVLGLGILAAVTYDSWQKQQQLRRIGRPLPPLEQPAPLIPESEKPVLVAPPEPDPESETASLSPEQYLLLYQDRAQTVRSGEEFKLSDGTPLTISNQPVSFQGIEDEDTFIYKYDPVIAVPGRARSPVYTPRISGATISPLPHWPEGTRMGDAIIDRYVIHVLSLSQDACRYVAEERSQKVPPSTL